MKARQKSIGCLYSSQVKSSSQIYAIQVLYCPFYPPQRTIVDTNHGYLLIRGGRGEREGGGGGDAHTGGQTDRQRVKQAEWEREREREREREYTETDRDRRAETDRQIGGGRRGEEM